MSTIVMVVLIGSPSAVATPIADEEPVPEDAIQQPFDAPAESIRPIGEENLGYVSFSRPDGAAARGYARKHGVSPERASEILDWQANVNSDLPSIAEELGPRYAGAKFSDTDEGPSVLVYVYRPDSSDELLVGDLPGDARLVPSVDDAPGLERRLSAAMAAAQAFDPAHRVGGTIDPATGEIALKVREGSDSTACTPSSTETGGQLDGGRSFRVKKESANCGQRGCTLGFSAYFNGRQGSVTASHCVDEGFGLSYSSSGFMYSSSSDWDWWIEAQCQNPCNGHSGGNQYAWAALRPYYRDSKPDDDFAFVREKYGSTAPSSDIYAVGVGFMNIWGRQTESSFPALNTVVCHSGGKDTASGPGEYCGEVTDWIDYASNGSSTQYWTEAEMYEHVDTSGSSGGPWYRGFSGNSVIAMGIMTAHTNDHVYNTYERIGPVVSGLAGHSSTSTYLYCDQGYGLMACPTGSY